MADATPIEIPLTGGNTSVVVRVGDTVRRSTGAWTPAVHRLLRHLEDVGFEAAPRLIGTDDQGREVLTFLDGTVAAGSPWPPQFWRNSTLEQAARLLARYHRAVAGYRPAPGSVWWYGPKDLEPGQVVCHNDAAPYNTVLGADGTVRGFIDWDVAGPGEPSWDLAFMAWQWVPLHHPALTARLGGPDETCQADRLRLLCAAYGETDLRNLLRLVAARVAASRDGVQLGARQGEPTMIRLRDEGHLDDMNRTLDYLDRRLPTLAHELDLLP